MTRYEFHQQLEEGLDHVFGLGYRARERYTFGWEDPRDLLNTRPLVAPGSADNNINLGAYNDLANPFHVETSAPAIEEPRFEIRWWHRVLYFFYKLARRCL